MYHFDYPNHTSGQCDIGMHYFIEHPSEELKLLVWILAARRKYKLINELQRIIDKKIMSSRSNSSNSVISSTILSPSSESIQSRNSLISASSESHSLDGVSIGSK